MKIGGKVEQPVAPIPSRHSHMEHEHRGTDIAEYIEDLDEVLTGWSSKIESRAKSFGKTRAEYLRNSESV